MHYEVEIAGRVRRVEVARAGDTFAVTIDGHARQVDVARIDGNTLSLLVDNAWLRNVTISPDAASGQVVLVGTTPVAVTLNGRRGARRSAEGGTTGSGPQRVTAPMPGKVVRILAKTGDAVHARQPVVVIEAMKMENELRAARDGIVTEIHTDEGASVDAGALLLIIQ